VSRDLREGIEAAREAIDSGKASEKLDALIEFSQGFAL
jgi:anthranilate phosphoribosyltransferase